MNNWSCLVCLCNHHSRTRYTKQHYRILKIISLLCFSLVLCEYCHLHWGKTTHESTKGVNQEHRKGLRAGEGCQRTQILRYIPSYLTSPLVATEVNSSTIQFTDSTKPERPENKSYTTRPTQALGKFELAVKWDSLKKLYTNISREK